MIKKRQAKTEAIRQMQIGQSAVKSFIWEKARLLSHSHIPTVTKAKSIGKGHLQKFSTSQALCHVSVGAAAGEPDSPPTF